ncbi:MAG: DUF1761 domain-containing protein [Pseudolabrys sp.]|nr:DUF1761 domain-containing protein [Pseudolabrys sp.]MSP32583.1 DUF1761 domain-containing protein [Pseudolabrys sp.]
MAFASVNYLSILIAAVAAWIFGGIYYTSLSKLWLAAQGKSLEQCQAEQAAKSGAAKVAPFILVFVGELIIGWVLYGILLHLNMFTLRTGIISGALCWFGFVLTTMTVNNAFCGRKPMLTVIDGGGWLGALVIIGAIVGWMGP